MDRCPIPPSPPPLSLSPSLISPALLPSNQIRLRTSPCPSAQLDQSAWRRSVPGTPDSFPSFLLGARSGASVGGETSRYHDLTVNRKKMWTHITVKLLIKDILGPSICPLHIERLFSFRRSKNAMGNDNLGTLRTVFYREAVLFSEGPLSEVPM